MAKLEWKELLARAKRSGVSQDAIDDAMDADGGGKGKGKGAKRKAPGMS